MEEQFIAVQVLPFSFLMTSKQKKMSLCLEALVFFRAIILVVTSTELGRSGGVMMYYKSMDRGIGNLQSYLYL